MAWRFSSAARTSAVTLEISPAADSIRWARHLHRRKQWQADQAVANKPNFRRAIAARKCSQPTVRLVIRPTALVWPVSIHRSLAQNLRPAARAGRRRLLYKVSKARPKLKANT